MILDNSCQIAMRFTECTVCGGVAVGGVGGWVVLMCMFV